MRLLREHFPDEWTPVSRRKCGQLEKLERVSDSIKSTRALAAVAAVGALFGLAIGVQLAAAHHSTTMFDHSKTLTIRGIAMELRWVNPHVSLLVKGIVDGNNEEEEWLMEMTSPGNLVRAGGWSRNAVKAGDRVVVDFSPLRDASSRGGALKKVTLVDTGQSFTANIRAQEMPGLE
jgi:hypothetical protein